MKLDNRKLYIPNELGSFYVIFLTAILYIHWGKFIIVKVTIAILSHQAPSNVMLSFKRLYLNLLNVVVLLALKVILIDHCTILPPLSKLLTRYMRTTDESSLLRNIRGQ